MFIKKKSDYTLIQTKNQSFEDFLAEFELNYRTFQLQNLILDLTNLKNKSTENINKLIPWVKQSKKLKKSFIVIIQDIDIDLVLNQITCTPTLLEAEDILEMENMERDLGF